MLISYERGFGLRDDPFKPNKPLDCTRQRRLMSNLHKAPLRVHEDRCLLRLFVGDAGPFSDHLRRFENLLRLGGYSTEEQTAPLDSFVFLITGPQGSGKSTLANAMIEWLGRCQLGSPWHHYEYPPPDASWNEAEPGLVAYLADRLRTDSKDDDYCSIVIDDLTDACQPAALRLFGDFSRTRTVVLILISSDLKLLKKATDNSRFDVNRLSTNTIAPEQAVALVSRRIEEFRLPSFRDRLHEYPLFPFDEEDIASAVSPVRNGQAVITLRTLGVSLHEALRERMMELDEAYDLAETNASALRSHLISLPQKYRENLPQ